MKSWFPIWSRVHTRFMILLTLLVCAVSILASPPSTSVQLIALALGVALVGVSHGALDHLVARPQLEPRLGRFWGPAFATGYIGLGAVIVVLWWVVPLFMLGAFLLASALHFGQGDVDRDETSVAAYPIEVLARGAIPIVVPCYFFNYEVARMFSWLLPKTVLVEAVHLQRLGAWALVVLVAYLLASSLSHVGQNHGRSIELMLEKACLFILFAVVPPLIAFLVYFCGWHSVRHILQMAGTLEMPNATAALSKFVRLAFPLTLITVVGALVLWQLLLLHGMALEPAAVKIIFIGLSAVAFPHMALTAWAASVGSRPRGSLLGQTT